MLSILFCGALMQFLVGLFGGLRFAAWSTVLAMTEVTLALHSFGA